MQERGEMSMRPGVAWTAALSVAVVVGGAVVAAPTSAGEPPTPPDCAASLTTLDKLAGDLRDDPSRRHDLALAYVDLAAAHLACGQPASARAVLADALRTDPTVRPTGPVASPELMTLLDAVRREVRPGQRGAGSTAWTVAGVLAAAGLAGGGYVLGSRLGLNDPPVLGVLDIEPTLGLASVTPISISTAPATDPEDDPIVYALDLGDGSGAETYAVQHVYRTRGSYTIRLEISDGRHRVSAPAATVTIKDLTGEWHGTMENLPDFTLRLRQEGTALYGTFSQDGRSATLMSGRIEAPNKVQIAFRHDRHTRLLDCVLSPTFDACTGIHKPPQTTFRFSR